MAAPARAFDDLAETITPIESARAAALRYVDDKQPGFRRRRTGRKVRLGKRWVPEFVIEDENGRRLRDPAALERIRKLAIPPAWTDVWICPFPEGHLQASGRDARKRKQYRYHPRWREERDKTKYARLVALGEALPALRRRIAADLRRPGLPREKVLATVVKLLETTFMRVGNEEYARSNRSFGLTTLEDRHVDVGRAEVRFHFRGKSGIYHEVSVRDPIVSRIVRRCRDLPGQELFQYLDEEGEPTAIDSADVNDYIRQTTGEIFTAKDFRTWAGTVLAASCLAEEAASAGRGRPSNRQVVQAIKRVARQLGNTPAVCRKSYVHPDLIGAYLDGELVSAMPARLAVAPSTHATALSRTETAVLNLLRQRLVAEKKGTRLVRQLRRSLRLVR